MTIPRHRGPDVYYDVSAVVPAADYGGGDDDGYWRWQHDDLQLMWVHLWVRVKEPIMAERRDLLDLFYYCKKMQNRKLKHQTSLWKWCRHGMHHVIVIMVIRTISQSILFI